MTPEGIWELAIATPVGRQEATLRLAWQGGALQGAVTSGDEVISLREVVLYGNRLTWSASMTKPIRLSLAFDVTINGDEMSGHAKAGLLPRSRVSGHRTGPVRP
jgi:hypothetical protein